MALEQMPVTLMIIAVTVAVSLGAWRQPWLMQRLLHWPPAVARGEWWRLISHGLIHADGAHLAFNMITLFFFGGVMERALSGRIGAGGFLLFYLAGIAIAALPSQWRHRGDPRFMSLGASGAVSSMLFAYILLQPWAMLLVFVVPVPAIVFAVVYVIYSYWAGQQNRDRINHSAHLWGALWGVVFMVALEPAVIGHFLNALMRP